MTPESFCASVLDELSAHSSDEGWARGARALCEMYAHTDAARFEAILMHLAAGRANTALGGGGQWLLARWHAAEKQS